MVRRREEEGDVVWRQSQRADWEERREQTLIRDESLNFFYQPGEEAEKYGVVDLSQSFHSSECPNYKNIAVDQNIYTLVGSLP